MLETSSLQIDPPLWRLLDPRLGGCVSRPLRAGGSCASLYCRRVTEALGLAVGCGGRAARVRRGSLRNAINTPLCETTTMRGNGGVGGHETRLWRASSNLCDDLPVRLAADERLSVLLGDREDFLASPGPRCLCSAQVRPSERSLHSSAQVLPRDANTSPANPAPSRDDLGRVWKVLESGAREKAPRTARWRGRARRGQPAPCLSPSSGKLIPSLPDASCVRVDCLCCTNNQLL